MTSERDNPSLFRNSSFILGLVSMIAFMAGGFAVCVYASWGQLMFSPTFFVLVPIPFGVAFAFIAYKLREKLHAKGRWSMFIAYTLIVDLVLVVVLYVLAMKWIEFWGVVRWM